MIYHFKEIAIQAIQGATDPLIAYAELKGYKQELDQAIKDLEPVALDESAKYGKSFELHICARNKQSLAFREELGELPFEQSITSYWDDSEHQHRFSASMVLAAKHHNSGLYVCGPSGFMSHVLNPAKAHAWPEASLFSETFVPPKVDTSDNKAFEVKIASSGEILQIAASEKLIDVLHENGYVVMCSCTQGICGSCITPVLEGVPDHRDAIMTDEDRASNRLMTVCVSRAKSERLLLDL